MKQLKFWSSTEEDEKLERVSVLEEKLKNLRRGFFVRHDHMLLSLTTAEEELEAIKKEIGIHSACEHKIIELKHQLAT